MKIEEIKTAITETETALTVALTDSERLPQLAGEQDAAGNTKEADSLFERGQTASMMVKRLTVKLDTLKQKYADELEINRRATATARLSEIERTSEKITDKLIKAAEELQKAWSSFVAIKADDPDIDLHGGRVLSRFFTITPPVRTNYLSNLPEPVQPLDIDQLKEVIVSHRGSVISEARHTLNI